MTNRRFLIWVGCFFAASMGIRPVGAKEIQLRNERIRPAENARGLAVARRGGTEKLLSGLYLLQVSGPLEPAWKEELGKLGVSLEAYVPTDSFLVRLRKVSPSALAGLAYVTWVGEYRADHKLHRSLQGPRRGRSAKGAGTTDVSILLAPNADPAAEATVRGRLGRLDQQVRHRFGTILRGAISSRQLDALLDDGAVMWVEPYQGVKLYDEVAAKIVAGDGGFQTTRMQALGYDGAGVTVAVADSGLDDGVASTMHPDLFGRVTGFFHYGTLTDGSDGHSHGTHVAGIVAGNGAAGEADSSGALYGLGVAPGASIIGQRIFDAAGGFQPPPTFEQLTRDAVQAGADIGSNSWGDDTQGRYDTFAAEFDALVRDADSTTPGDQPYILEFSAGNSGPGSQTIGTPAVAKNVIATGASQNNRFDSIIYADGQEAMADFSSRGPAEDGRIKPDIVAPGTWIASLQSSSASDQFAWGPISSLYQFQGGTSQAGPQVSGAAAVFVDYYRSVFGGQTPSPALVKAALINSAVDMSDVDGTEPVPNNDEGWGRVDLEMLVEPEQDVEFLDQTHPLAVGEWYEEDLVVASGDQPLRITLAYTDVPAFPGAIPALVNDLDLEVVGPDGRQYRGNQFVQGESVPDTSVADDINNVEGVHLATPLPGIYTVRVRAQAIIQDALTATPATDQDFALVLSGHFLPPGASTVFLDRGHYTAPDLLRMSVLDQDQAGASVLPVVIQSDTEPGGELVILAAAGPNGLFTNRIVTQTGMPATDNVLQVAHGDLITCTYQDLSAGTSRVASARADLVPPVISGVEVTEEFGRPILSWQTDEPANGLVQYGTNTTVGQSRMLPGYLAAQAVRLDDVVPGLTYFFRIIATDRAGNVVTNDNGGAFFQFVAPSAPDVLVVDAFFNDFFFSPPISNYTGPLDVLGVRYDVWDVLTVGAPTLLDLAPYRVVIWRVPEVADGATHPAFAEGMRTALRQYLEQGGSLLTASMEATSRVDETGDTAFRDEALQVAAQTSQQVDATVPGIAGVAGDPIADGVAIALDYSDYSFFDISDAITPGPQAVGIFQDTASGNFAGVRYPGPGVDRPDRVVFLSFPLDAIPVAGSAPNNRAGVLQRILQFLAPGLNGEAVVSLDRTAYTIPSQMSVEVADSDLAGTGTLPVTVRSDTEPGGQSVALAETSTAGVFEGAVTLVAATEPAQAGRLRVQEGDLVSAEFLDRSTGQLVSDSARVETVDPVLSGVSHQAEYIDAVVSWTTSEPTDALVQYSESPSFPVNRTAYEALLKSDHDVVLTGLRPDQTYFYKVISRDAAGNTGVDDNGGALYSFTTLEPLTPPWTDDVESGGTSWVVLDDEQSEVSWSVGTPNNGVIAQAHSPVNAWGSNLDGGIASAAATSLISPAIDLTGVSSATLTFWHNLTFGTGGFDLWELFTLEAITNNLSAPIPLAAYESDSAGWQQVSLDLTPLAGQVVFLVWQYQLFSFDFVPRPGWVLDDFELTALTPSGATILITNNLAQASWQLSGPAPATGQGLSTLLTNVPAGDYTLSFDPVLYYLSPSDQTNQVAAGMQAIFPGVYSFVDANSNGISDSYEQDVFEEVSTNRTATTDTDGDGMTDLGEFLAGTDPENTNSLLRLTMPTVQTRSTVEIQWDAVTGRAYRIEADTDGAGWEPFTEWLSATGTPATATGPEECAVNLLRLRARP